MGKSGEVTPIIPNENKSFLKKLFIAVSIVILILGAVYIIYEEIVEVSLGIDTTQIKNVFVDINGDGLIDYISSANVVLNTGNNLNLPVSP